MSMLHTAVWHSHTHTAAWHVCIAIWQTHTAKQAAGLILPEPGESNTDAVKFIQNVYVRLTAS